MHHITIPNGQKVTVHNIGDVKLTKNIMLKKVLYVPSFHFNLISVPKLVQDLKCSVVFNPSGCFCQGPSMKRPWKLGDLTKSLYHSTKQDGSIRTDFLTTASTSLQASNLSNNVEAIKLWHLRLEHIPANVLKYVDSTLCSEDFNNTWFVVYVL